MLPHKNRSDPKELLRKINGARLTSVEFVMNYLILGFDGKGALTTMVWPERIDGGESLQWGMSGYRDGLCGLITVRVKNASADTDETISIEFTNGVQLRIPLGTYKQPGERAIFTAPKNVLYTWGGSPFLG